MVVSGFRGFPTEQAFDLDADVVLLSGVNGSGKTSFFDALLWGLTGVVQRVGPSESLVSRFAEYGQCRVELELQGDDGGDLHITRSFSESQTLSVLHRGEAYKGSLAEMALISAIWPNGDTSADLSEAFSCKVTQSVYLQQDCVNAFVQASNEQQRFMIVADIVGAGQLATLNQQVESGRRAWTTGTTKLREEFRPTLDLRNSLVSKLNTLANDKGAFDAESAVRDWLKRAGAFVDRPESEQDVSRSVVESVLVEIRHLIGSRKNELSDMRRFRELLHDQPEYDGNMQEVEAEVASLEERYSNVTARILEAEVAAAEERRKSLAEAEDRRSLGAMAQLALQFLEPNCPVCGQMHEVAMTERRLIDLISEADLPGRSSDSEPLQALAEEAGQIEERLATARTELFAVRLADRRFNAWRDMVLIGASELSLPDDRQPNELDGAVASRIGELMTHISQLREIRSEGERNSALLVQAVEVAQAGDLRQRVARLDEEVRQHDELVSLRHQASDDAIRLHEAIRSLGESLVAEELMRVEPLLQRVYSTVDPHPAFRAVRFLTKMHRGRGRLWTVVEASDAENTIAVNEPKTVLSSSQLNVLAVAAFLSLNLSAAELPLKTIALDDPLQSLDNVNLLGLLDLLRHLRGRRQVILSTHDDRLASLLRRKLRPVRSGERTVSIEFSAWNTKGPTVGVRDIERDLGELRLVPTL